VNENEGEAMESAAIDREQAAEMLRSVEGMRRRTMRASTRLSPIPALVFGLAALVAAPFGFIEPKTWETIALAAGLLIAFAITDLHYQRQAVHPAEKEKPPRTTADIVVLVVLLVVFGRFILGTIFGFLFVLPQAAGSNASLLVLWTAIAIYLGKRVRNDALPIAAGFAMLTIPAALFIWNDYWEAVAAAMYGGVFLTASLVARVAGRRAA
jgi:hypothetical protein